MAYLKNHPGKWLRDDAAQAIDAYEAAHGVLRLTSAGRTVAEQADAIHRYYTVGGPHNRPPYLYAPMRPAEESSHVKHGGIAVDVTDYYRFTKHAKEFGFEWYGPNDPVHFTFTGTKNTHNENDWEDMLVNIEGTAGRRSGGAYYIAGGQATFLGGFVEGASTLSATQADVLATRVSGL